MGFPIVFLSSEYFEASSSARWDKPTAAAATGGRVLSKAAIAYKKPAPSFFQVQMKIQILSSDILNFIY